MTIIGCATEKGSDNTGYGTLAFLGCAYLLFGAYLAPFCVAAAVAIVVQVVTQDS